MSTNRERELLNELKELREKNKELVAKNRELTMQNSLLVESAYARRQEGIQGQVVDDIRAQIKRDSKQLLALCEQRAELIEMLSKSMRTLDDMQKLVAKQRTAFEGAIDSIIRGSNLAVIEKELLEVGVNVGNRLREASLRLESVRDRRVEYNEVIRAAGLSFGESHETCTRVIKEQRRKAKAAEQAVLFCEEMVRTILAELQVRDHLDEKHERRVYEWLGDEKSGIDVTHELCCLIRTNCRRFTQTRAYPFCRYQTTDFA